MFLEWQCHARGSSEKHANVLELFIQITLRNEQLRGIGLRLDLGLFICSQAFIYIDFQFLIFLNFNTHFKIH
jgi:hypothetical protein